MYISIYVSILFICLTVEYDLGHVECCSHCSHEQNPMIWSNFGQMR